VAGIGHLPWHVVTSRYSDLVLGRSLQAAAEHPFYREFWGAASADAVSQLDPGDAPAALAMLVKLPSATKHDLQGRLAPRIDADADFIAEVIHSSGTSADSFSFRYRSRFEIEAISEFQAASAGRGRPNEMPRLCMNLVSMFHGQQINRRSTRDTTWISASVADDLFVSHAIRLLRCPPPGLRSHNSFEAITGPVADLRVLTQCISDTGGDPSSFKIGLLSTYGARLSPATRQFLENSWKCPVLETFSISELAGGGHVCPGCGYISFDPHLLPSAEPVGGPAERDGPLSLRLTELLPYGRCQPLIKYDTGDLVEIVGTRACRPQHAGGFRHVGRAAASAVVETAGGTVVVGSNAVRDALEAAGVDRAQAFTQLSHLRHRERIGSPYGALEVSPEATPPSVRVRYRSRRLGASLAPRIADGLLSTNHQLRQAADRRVVSLEVVHDPDMDERLPM
jgi:phenylacetate-coenzyme A ligase PaaK-like adenylate-forming protein